KSKISLALFRRPDLARYRIARPQIKLPDLRRRDIYIVRAWQIVVLGSAQKAKAVGQRLEHTLRKYKSALFCLSGQQLKDKLLLSKPRGSLYAHPFCDMRQLADRHIFQSSNVKSRVSVRRALGALGCFLAVSVRRFDLVDSDV